MVPGRVMRVTASVDGYYWAHYNIHNHGLNGAQVQSINRHILEDIQRVRNDPSHNFLIINGDFNFLPPGEQHHSLSQPVPTMADHLQLPHQCLLKGRAA